MLGGTFVQLVHSVLILMKSKVIFIFTWTWILALNLLIVGKGFPPLRPSLLLVLSMIFIASSVYIYNDIVDVEMDKENEIKKNRPIASGLIGKRDAQKIVYILGLAGLSFAWFVNITSFSIILTFFILFYLYSYPPIRLKKRFLAKDFTLLIGAPLLCLAATYGISSVFSTLAFSSAILTAIFSLTISPVVNESSDIVEDNKYGVKSLSTLLNWENKIRLMILGIIIHMISMPFILLTFGSNLILPFSSVVLLLILLRFTYPLSKGYELNRYNKAKKISAIYVLTSPMTFIIISTGSPLFLMPLF
jgi:4-hydroxybenzoate polyprenyltransferase